MQGDEAKEGSWLKLKSQCCGCLYDQGSRKQAWCLDPECWVLCPWVVARGPKHPRIKGAYTESLCCMHVHMCVCLCVRARVCMCACATWEHPLEKQLALWSLQVSHVWKADLFNSCSACHTQWSLEQLYLQSLQVRYCASGEDTQCCSSIMHFAGEHPAVGTLKLGPALTS